MSTHPDLDELADGVAVKNALDGDLTKRRKDEQTSGYLDDINAIKAEMARAPQEGRSPDLTPYTDCAIGAAGVHIKEPNTSKDVPEVIDLNAEKDALEGTPDVAAPAKKVQVKGLKGKSLDPKAQPSAATVKANEAKKEKAAKKTAATKAKKAKGTSAATGDTATTKAAATK